MALYFLRDLQPRRENEESSHSISQILVCLTPLQLLQVFCGWLAWTCDAIDFFTLVFSVTALQDLFNKSTGAITTSITLTPLFRPTGAIIFGILSDRYGRRWPLVGNLAFLCAFQIASGFVKTFQQFLALRSLFGVCMGGAWSLAAATALENLPVEARGLISGILQLGYSIGYVIAALINLKLVPIAPAGWRALFWTAAGLTGLAIIVRIIIPESELFLRARRQQQDVGTKSKTRVFLQESKEMLKRHWLLCIYAVVLMSAFNFLSHGSQDLYPTYLRVTKGFTASQATTATTIGNCGAIAGGVITGWVSQYLGRRVTMIIGALIVGAFIPLWMLPTSFSGLAGGVFFLQFGVQATWSLIPIFLSEISPSAFRGTFAGVSYQLGNMISAASAQIETTGGRNMRTTIIVDGVPTEVPDYAKVQRIFIGAVVAGVIATVLIGPEHYGAHFERYKAAFEEGAGKDEVAEVVEETEKRRESESGSQEKV